VELSQNIYQHKDLLLGEDVIERDHNEFCFVLHLGFLEEGGTVFNDFSSPHMQVVHFLVGFRYFGQKSN